MRRRLHLILALLLAACGGQLSAGDSVSGTWTGAFTSTGVPLTLELTQAGVSLDATLTVGESSVALIGTIAASPADTLISLASQGADPVQIEASVSGDTMRGTLAVTAAGDISAGSFTASR